MKNISRSMFILSFLMLFSLGANAKWYTVEMTGYVGCIKFVASLDINYDPSTNTLYDYHITSLTGSNGCKTGQITNLGISTGQISIMNNDKNENLTYNQNEFEDSWSLYPNPASDFVKVKYNLSESSYKKHQNVSVSLVNIYGGTTVITDAHKIYSSTLTGTKGELLVNLSNIPKGMYWLMVMGENDEVLTTKKLIK